ncbi:hypothetical protein ACHAW5_003377 [Stephanodiscus triporus]|uniref:Uncharacterized protein n=1 Tax=Stephanodiscus triporus TaxID=2934178 RepID=A0ABD3NDT2_9STRA
MKEPKSSVMRRDREMWGLDERKRRDCRLLVTAKVAGTNANIGKERITDERTRKKIGPRK